MWAGTTKDCGNTPIDHSGKAILGRTRNPTVAVRPTKTNTNKNKQSHSPIIDLAPSLVDTEAKISRLANVGSHVLAILAGHGKITLGTVAFSIRVVIDAFTAVKANVFSGGADTRLDMAKLTAIPVRTDTMLARMSRAGGVDDMHNVLVVDEIAVVLDPLAAFAKQATVECACLVVRRNVIARRDLTSLTSVSVRTIASEDTDMD